jgi:SAM-dependent methyltransferase
MDAWAPPTLRWKKEPYQGKAFRQLHPDHLGAAAALHEIAAAPSERCRLLEIGCGDGWNLLPMAEELPDSEFVGIDLDGGRIELGRQALAALGLENLTLQVADFAALDPSLGPFDYIVAHGVYSWVSDALRTVFFEQLAKLLGERGIAYVSANVYPGWRCVEPARELGLFHAHQSEAREGEPLLARLRSLARFFAENMPRGTPDAALVAEQYRQLSGASDYLCAFDQLGPTRPEYFEPIVRRAERAGLCFVADSAMLSGQYARLPERLRQGIAELTGDSIQREQYADFCALPSFRQFLFSKAPPKPPSAERLRGLYLVGGFRQADQSDPTHPGAAAFQFGNLKLTVTEPAVKLALLEIGAVFPHALVFEEVEQRVASRLGRDSAPPELLASLLELALLGPLTVRARGVVAAKTAGARPRISEASRIQLTVSERATTALHTFATILSVFDREALRAMDGRRTKSEIAKHLALLVQSGAIPMSELGTGSQGDLDAAVAKRLAKTLEDAARFLLLLPEA